MFTVFDLETTGFSTLTHDVIQFAYITYDENNAPIRAESLYFYYEGMSWTEEAYETHKIPMDFLKTQEDKFEENVIKMYAVLMNSNVVGHNALSFDTVFATNWLARMGMPKLTFRCIQDTMIAFKPISKRPRIKLTKLAEMLGVTDAIVLPMAQRIFNDPRAIGAHNAAVDVARTAIITLVGIGKGFISFNGVIAPVDDAAVDELYDTTDTASQDSNQRDPNSFLIYFEEDGEVQALLVSTNPGFYRGTPTATELKMIRDSGRVILKPFKYVNGQYVLNYYSMEFTVKVGKDSDEFLFKPTPNSTPIQFLSWANHVTLAATINKEVG